MPEEKMYTARWIPGWYELDQSLIVGQLQKFWFFQTPPADHLHEREPVDFVFYNQLSSPTNCQVRYAKILEIYHPELGPLTRIDTDGMDYIFVTAEGEEIAVNAEEEPGATYDDEVAIDDWSVLVTLSEISEPVADFV